MLALGGQGVWRGLRVDRCRLREIPQPSAHPIHGRPSAVGDDGVGACGALGAAALRLLPDTPDVEAQRVELSIAMASAHAASGELDEARRISARSSSGCRPRILAACPSSRSAPVEHMLGRNRAADARLLQAYRQQPDVDSAEAVLLQLELAGGCALAVCCGALQLCCGVLELGDRFGALAAAGERFGGEHPAASGLDGTPAPSARAAASSAIFAASAALWRASATRAVARWANVASAASCAPCRSAPTPWRSS